MGGSYGITFWFVLLPALIASSLSYNYKRALSVKEAVKETDGLSCGDIFFKKAGSGCYRDDKSPPPLPELILTDRDSSSPVYSGKNVDYGNWDTYMPDLICRCAEKAFSLKKPIFGLEFYGECWSSNETDTYSKDGPASEDRCETFAFKKCTATDAKCVGKQNSIYVYKIEEVKPISPTTPPPTDLPTSTSSSRSSTTPSSTSPPTSPPCCCGC